MLYSAIIYGKTIARVHLGHLNECTPAPDDRQLVGQAANFTFMSACRLPSYRHSPIARGGLHRLVVWHLPHGPVGPSARARHVKCCRREWNGLSSDKLHAAPPPSS